MSEIPKFHLISWCGNLVETQFWHCFAWFAQNSAETTRFEKDQDENMEQYEESKLTTSHPHNKICQNSVGEYQS